MKYHLYYHDDFDGISSGAVMLNFLCSRGDKIVSYNPIDYTPKINENWVKYKFKKPFILVDFRYHPAADWWFDHHRTSFAWPALKNWGKKYKNDSRHFQDPRFKSCASLVLARLITGYKYKAPKHIKDLTRWADIVDGMGFKSANEAINYSKPGLKMLAYLDSENNQKNRKGLIKLLAEESIAAVVRNPKISQKSRQYTAKVLRTTKQLRAASLVVGSVVFVDAGKEKDVRIHHYMIYYLFPQKKYSVLLKRKGSCFRLGVGANPWSKSGKFADIGRLMSKYGGGGHKTVGATQRKSKSELLKIAKEIIKYLNQHG